MTALDTTRAALDQARSDCADADEILRMVRAGKCRSITLKAAFAEQIAAEKAWFAALKADCDARGPERSPPGSGQLELV